MSLSKGIVSSLVLGVRRRAMPIAGSWCCAIVVGCDRGVSCVALRLLQPTVLGHLLWLAARGAVVSRVVVRGCLMHFMLFSYRRVSEWRALDVDAGISVFDLVVELPLVARNGLRDRTRSPLSEVCYAMVIDRACGSTAAWLWDWSRKTTTRCRKTVANPSCSPLKERKPLPCLLELCERVSCMRFSSMVRDSTKVSVLTVDAVRGSTFCFAGYWWCIGARCANSLFVAVSSMSCGRFGRGALVALCCCSPLNERRVGLRVRSYLSGLRSFTRGSRWFAALHCVCGVGFVSGERCRMCRVLTWEGGRCTWLLSRVSAISRPAS